MSSQVEKRPYAKRQPRHVRREQILDAAAELIVAEGWGAMTMDRVAADAGIAKSVIYAIFESQAGLQEKLMQRAQDRAFSLSAEALSATATAGDLASAITAGLTTFVRGVAEQPDTWRLALFPSEGAPESVRDAIRDGRERWRNALEQVAAEQMQGTGVSDVDPELVAHVARGNAEYLARLLLEDPDQFPAERLATFVENLASSLRNPEPAA